MRGLCRTRPLNEYDPRRLRSPQIIEFFLEAAQHPIYIVQSLDFGECNFIVRFLWNSCSMTLMVLCFEDNEFYSKVHQYLSDVE